MKTSCLLIVALLATLSLQLSTAFAQGTAFTYQGRLNDGANPANGNYDLRLAIYDAASGGAQQGNVLTNSATAVSNGLFTVTLDFGNQFPGAPRWLEIAVRTNGGGAFTALTPRQALTSTPYAIQALNAASAAAVSGSIPAAQITGTVPLARLPAGVVTNGASGVNISGTFSGNGAGVTNVPLGSINSGGAITWPGAFVVSSHPPAGFGSYSVTSVDVNGDGKPDLISTFGAVDVLTNNGSGGFAVSSSIGVGLGLGPLSATSTDVNGDGKPDLISANAATNTLTVLTNSGTGGFVVASSPVVGISPQSVTSADVNGDGKPDLISANTGYSEEPGNTLTVLTNNGSGGFAVASSPDVGSGPHSVTSADVNGDGKPDLINANANTNTLTVLTNNGNGGFVVSSSPVVGLRPFSVTSADMNGDGRPDLISANYFADTLTVLTNSGRGTLGLAFSPRVGRFQFSKPRSVVSTDLNGDGRPDLVSANEGDSLTVLFSTAIFTGRIVGDGSGLTSVPAPASVPAENLTGTLADARLSTNVALLDGTQTFTGHKTFTNGTFRGTFSGNGEGLTVQAENLIGEILDSQLSFNVALRAGGNTFSGSQIFTGFNIFSNGTFNGNGAGLTALNASQLASGTVADARLSTNVALRTGGNVFSGNQIITNGALTSSGVEIVGGSSAPALRYTGARVGDFNAAVGLALNNNTTGTSSPALRVANLGGNSQDGALSVSANGIGNIARFGNNTAYVSTLTTNGTWTALAFTPTSDRAAKENFTSVDARKVLEKVAALPLARWTYKAAPGVEHIGPVAQDFHAAFGLNGEDDKHIATVDADGVALAAIQGLNQKLEESQRENASLKERVEKLERLLKQLIAE